MLHQHCTLLEKETTYSTNIQQHQSCFEFFHKINIMLSINAKTMIT